QRRELERLGEEAQRHPLLGELCLEPRAIRSGLDARRSRDVVDFEHAVQRAQVEAHRRAIDARLDPADDARAAAVRDHGGARAGRGSATATASAPPMTASSYPQPQRWRIRMAVARLDG